MEWREFDWHNQYYTSKMKLNKWMKWMFDFMGPTAKKPQRANQLFLKRMVELWVVGYGWGPALCAAWFHSTKQVCLHSLIDAPRERISWGEEAETERLKILKWNADAARGLGPSHNPQLHQFHFIPLIPSIPLHNLCFISLLFHASTLLRNWWS